MKETASGEAYFSQNLTHSDNSLRLMLDGESTLKEVEVFLKGYYVIPKYDEATGETIYEKIHIGVPKANAAGVQSIMFWLKTKITPLTSLSNMSNDQYGDYLYRTRTALSRNLMVQRHKYEISLSNYTEIIDIVMETLEPFLTSAITGGHRKSFTTNQETKRVENTIQEKNKIFGGLI